MAYPDRIEVVGADGDNGAEGRHTVIHSRRGLPIGKSKPVRAARPWRGAVASRFPHYCQFAWRWNHPRDE